MKHLFKLALLGAAVIVAASCHREVAEEVNNPNFNRETNEVKTNFIFNIATQAKTKQSSGAAQAHSTDLFRGIENAKLFTYQIPSTDYVGILPADATSTKVYELAKVASSSQVTAEENRRVLELSLPLMTNVLLFYGRAPYGDTYGGYANLYDCYGHLDSYTIGATAGSTVFTAGCRLAEEDYDKFVTVEKMFAGIQTLLLNHSIAAGTTISATDGPDGVANKYGFDATIPTGGINWKMYASDTGKSPYTPTANRYPLENKLSHLYKQLTTIRTSGGELRAGTGEATLRIAQDLFTVLNEIRCASPISVEETVAKYFANEVFERMNKYFAAETNNSGAPITGVSFKNPTTIATAFLSNEEKAFRPAAISANTNIWPSAEECAAVAAYDPAEFPFNFNLPRGGTYIAFMATQELTPGVQTEVNYFYYPQEFNVSGMTGLPGSGDKYNGKSYFYPSELLYFANSPIRATDSDKAFADYPKGSGDGENEWNNEDSWGTEWSGNIVKASTRAVAMKHNINYGVALLETKVKYDESIYEGVDAGYIYDNNHQVQVENNGVGENEEPDNKIEVTDGMFKVTGLIIGGQPKAIGWDHLPVKINVGTTQTPDYQYKYGFVYDKAIPAAAQPVPGTNGLTSSPNYTLVFDNFHAAGETNGIYTPDTQDNVSVAIEFRNDTGKDIYGNHNMIRNGGYFYLIGLLNLSSATNNITWPSDHVVPPYKADGTSQEVKRVFIQDFMTTATFRIGKNSLHNAYLTVPDLRSASMTLGLSVDLNWETGLNFDDVNLGY